MGYNAKVGDLALRILSCNELIKPKMFVCRIGRCC